MNRFLRVKLGGWRKRCDAGHLFILSVLENSDHYVAMTASFPSITCWHSSCFTTKIFPHDLSKEMWGHIYCSECLYLSTDFFPVV